MGVIYNWPLHHFSIFVSETCGKVGRETFLSVKVGWHVPVLVLSVKGWILDFLDFRQKYFNLGFNLRKKRESEREIWFFNWSSRLSSYNFKVFSWCWKIAIPVKKINGILIFYFCQKCGPLKMLLTNVVKCVQTRYHNFTQRVTKGPFTPIAFPHTDCVFVYRLQQTTAENTDHSL